MFHYLRQVRRRTFAVENQSLAVDHSPRQARASGLLTVSRFLRWGTSCDPKGTTRN